MKAINRAKPGNVESAPTLWQTITSVLAAFFGVQSSANRRRDFSRGRPAAFFIVAIALTLLFVAALVVLVQVIVRQAAA